MNSEEQVRSALKALAEHDRGLESSTPASAIFAQRRVAPRYRVQWWLVGAAAAVAAFALALRMPTPKPKIPEVQIIEHPRIPVQTARAVEPAPPPKAKPVRRTKPVPRRIPEQPQEIATDFFPLMDAPPPMERGQIVRVVVPASTMRTVGLPITPERWNDRVQADVLVGEEGMARAIRFVSFTQ